MLFAAACSGGGAVSGVRLIGGLAAAFCWLDEDGAAEARPERWTTLGDDAGAAGMAALLSGDALGANGAGCCEAV